MIVNKSTVLRAAGEEDWPQIRRLINRAGRVHSHLDWQQPKFWLGTPSFVVLCKGSKLLGLLAMPPEVSGVAWLRLAAVADGLDARWIIDQLYALGRSALEQLGVARLAVLSAGTWLEPVLAEWGFAASDLVLVLIRARRSIPTCIAASPRIRAAQTDDLAHIASIDKDAFAVPWVYSRGTLRSALKQAEYSTVAEVDGQIVGYQISTGGCENGHMARLAVHPVSQNRGIGRALVSDVIRYFASRFIPTISVNTQEDNDASLSLYRSLGFQQSGDAHVVWQLWLRPRSVCT